MERKLIDYLPYVIRDYAEFQGIMGSEQPEIEKAWNTTDDLLDNQFIPTAGHGPFPVGKDFGDHPQRHGQS